MADGEFDLLQAAGAQANRVFRVTFDFYTPRAHFIILPRKGGKWKDLADLNSDAKGELLATANAMVEAYTLASGGDCPILSIHRGSWVTTLGVFHAHLCVGVDTYLNVFDQKKSGLPNWPSSAYVTKQWKASKNPNDYATNVRGYPYRTYVQQEVAEVIKLQRSGVVGPGVGSFHATPLLYNRRQPSVGLKVDRGLYTLDLMETFARDQGLTTAGNRDGNKGCHLCISIGAVLRHDGVELSGYMQLTGPMFYKLCPAEKRADFLQNFQHWDGKIYT